MATNKPERIIIISTPSALVSSVLERLQRLTDWDTIVMLALDKPFPTATKREISIKNLTRWDEDMTFCATEEKSLQPTNPYFGKESWVGVVVNSTLVLLSLRFVCAIATSCGKNIRDK